MTLLAGRHGSTLSPCWPLDKALSLCPVPKVLPLTYSQLPPTPQFFFLAQTLGTLGTDLWTIGPGVNSPLSVEKNDFLSTESPLPAGFRMVAATTPSAAIVEW